jgi:hypothetical protein
MLCCKFGKKNSSQNDSAKYIFNLFHFEVLIQNRNPKFRSLTLFVLTFHEYKARFVFGFWLDYKPSLFIFLAHLAKGKVSQLIRNKNRLWRPCLLTDRDEISNRFREPSIYAFYQFSVHLAEGFQYSKCSFLYELNYR